LEGNFLDCLQGEIVTVNVKSLQPGFQCSLVGRSSRVAAPALLIFP